MFGSGTKGFLVMNKIVRQHYPVSKLPEDLQQEFSGLETVTVVGENISMSAEPATSHHSFEDMMTHIKPMSFRELMADRDAHPENYQGKVTTEEAVARIRALRDEWDDVR
jgi:hypothetical protein